MNRAVFHNCLPPGADQEDAQRLFPIAKRIAVIAPLLRKLPGGSSFRVASCRIFYDWFASTSNVVCVNNGAYQRDRFFFSSVLLL